MHVITRPHAVDRSLALARVARLDTQSAFFVCVKGVCEYSLHTLMHRKMHSIHDEVQAVKPFCFRLFHMLLNRQACTPHGVIARPNGAHGWSAGPARGSSGWWQAGFCPIEGRQAISPPLDGQTGRGATQELPGLSHLCGGAAQEQSSSCHALENREQSSRILGSAART